MDKRTTEGAVAPHSDAQVSHTGPVWDFLTATRDEPAFRSIRDKFLDFDLRDVPDASGAAGLLWFLRCDHDAGAVQHGRPLDDIVADRLRLLADKDADARDALAWLCVPDPIVYKLSEAPQVARRLVEHWLRPAPASRWAFTPLSELRERPRPKWLIQDILVEGTAVVLSGDSQSFKTFSALDMALCIATGTPWHGRAVVRGPVVYIAAEGGWTLRDRLEAWEIARGITVADADFHLLETPVAIGDPATVAAFSAFIEAKAPRFVVIDTLSACAEGLKENASEDMATFVRHMKAVARATGATSAAIHHNNKGGDLRGAVSLKNDADTHITFERTGEEEELQTLVSCSKHRGGRFPKFALRGEEVTLSTPDEYGRAVSSLVFEQSEEVPASENRTNRTSAKERTGAAVLEQLATLRATATDGAKVSKTDWEEAVTKAGICSRSRFYVHTKELETACRWYWWKGDCRLEEAPENAPDNSPSPASPASPVLAKQDLQDAPDNSLSPVSPVSPPFFRKGTNETCRTKPQDGDGNTPKKARISKKRVADSEPYASDRNGT